eukprot:1502022-Amphidinium_carterae.1
MCAKPHSCFEEQTAGVVQQLIAVSAGCSVGLLSTNPPAELPFCVAKVRVCKGCPLHETTVTHSRD